MRNATVALLVTAFLGTAATASFGADSVQPTRHDDGQERMDSNHDGMISKDEYMKYQESMWMKMTKDSSGMVSMQEMQMLESGKMNNGSMMKDCAMTKDGSMIKEKAK